MDFFAQQDKAHRKTKLLVFYFALAVITLIAATYFVVLFAFTAGQAHQYSQYGYQSNNGAPAVFVWWNPQIFLGVTAGVLAVIFIGSAYKQNELSGGGAAVATLMGGRRR